jgi:carnitine O-acetyltransferase
MFSLSAYRTNQPKTFSNQSKLPRLPVPDLNKSLEAYLKSLIPLLEQKVAIPNPIVFVCILLTTQYDAATVAKELEKRKIYARDFAATGGLGRALQERLKDLDHVSPHNWLDDTLWLGLAYHTWRAPLLVNSNWWLLFRPDPKDPPPPAYSEASSPGASPVVTPDPNPKEIKAKGSQRGGEEWLKGNHQFDLRVSYEEATTREWVSDWQIRKAAWVIRRFAEFRTKLQRYAGITFGADAQGGDRSRCVQGGAVLHVAVSEVSTGPHPS